MSDFSQLWLVRSWEETISLTGVCFEKERKRYDNNAYGFAVYFVWEHWWKFNTLGLI